MKRKYELYTRLNSRGASEKRPHHPRFRRYMALMKETRYFGSHRIFRTAVLSDEECQMRYGHDLEPEARNVLRSVGCEVNEDAPRVWRDGLSTKADGICTRVPGLPPDREYILEIKTWTEEGLPRLPTLSHLEQTGFHLDLYEKDCLLVVYNGERARVFLVEYRRGRASEKATMWTIAGMLSSGRLPIGKVTHLFDIGQRSREDLLSDGEDSQESRMGPQGKATEKKTQ